jgi:hypothetical protein
MDDVPATELFADKCTLTQRREKRRWFGFSSLLGGALGKENYGH